MRVIAPCKGQLQGCQRRAHGQHEQDGAHPVDLAAAVMDGTDAGEIARQQEKRAGGGDGGNEERRPPAQRLRGGAAQDRADTAGHGECRRHERHPSHPLLGVGEKVGGRGERRSDHHAAAHPLQGTEHDQLGHGLRQSTGDGAQRDDQDGHQHQGLAAEHVAQTAEDQDGSRGGQKIASSHPRIERHAVERLGHARQGGADDGGVQRGEHHGCRYPGHGHQQIPAGAGGIGGWLGRWRRRSHAAKDITGTLGLSLVKRVISPENRDYQHH
ncbi:hypothetical protein D3C86_1324670 [compost metagenome]